MRRALIVGIDDYDVDPLSGCVNDARNLCELLATHDNGEPNFECRLLTAPEGPIERPDLLRQIDDLFGSAADVALLHFSGHGTVNNLDGYLVTQKAARYEEGVGMSEILRLANASKAREVVILLDCCHSGALGNLPRVDNTTQLREGVSIMTASRDSQAALEANGGGLFSSLVQEALRGGAADVLGDVTLAGVYAYADRLLGAWDQRPLYKSHVSQMVRLRRCSAPIDRSLLRKLPDYFPDELHQYPVDPSYDSELEPRHEEHERIFAHFREYLRIGLLVPVGAQYLYHAAKDNKACRLTRLGRFFWKLAREKKL